MVRLLVIMGLITLLASAAEMKALLQGQPEKMSDVPKNLTIQAAQLECKFPEDNPSDRLLVQNRKVFKAYHGRGKIFLENHGVTDAKIYINGQLIMAGDFFKKEKETAMIDVGAYTVDGLNTIKVSDISPKNAYITVNIPYPELMWGQPEDAGFNRTKLEKIDNFINAEVEQGFPGAVLLVVKNGMIIKNSAYGFRKIYQEDSILSQKQSMTADTMFDLASNTKMFATNFALMQLTSQGKLHPDDLVSKYLPDFIDSGREKIRLRDLMTHSAGFPPDVKFYSPKESGSLYSLNRDKVLKSLSQIPLVYELGSKTMYSDIDYILLGYIVEIVTNQRLDGYVETTIYRPLGLTNTLYNPLQKGFFTAQFAATERNGNTRDHLVYFPGIRNYTLQGEVHDEKAYYSFAGVAGHAGLFSRAQDLAVLAQVILNGGGYGDFRLCDQATVAQYSKTSDKNMHYGLGWDKNNVWEFGPYASDQAIGHTGWVGTVVCIDPKYDLAVILLTNKVHSPFISAQNKFVGNKFETGKYGSIISMVYEALLEKK